MSTTRFPSQSFDEIGCDYFLFPTPGKKDHITMDLEILSPYFAPSQVTKQYGTYMVSPATKPTTTLMKVTIDKSLQFQVNRLNIARDTSIRAQPKNSFQNLNFFIPSVTLTLIYLYKPFYNFNMSTPTNIPETPMGETKQDSSFESKEKFQQQLQDIFQTTLRLTGPDQFDQLCQWMEYCRI